MGKVGEASGDGAAGGMVDHLVSIRVPSDIPLTEVLANTIAQVLVLHYRHNLTRDAVFDALDALATVAGWTIADLESAHGARVYFHQRLTEAIDKRGGANAERPDIPFRIPEGRSAADNPGEAVEPADGTAQGRAQSRGVASRRATAAARAAEHPPPDGVASDH